MCPIFEALVYLFPACAILCVDAEATPKFASIVILLTIVVDQYLATNSNRALILMGSQSSVVPR